MYSTLWSIFFKELLEDSQCIEDPLVEGVTFLVKYLGKEPVDNNNEEEQTAAAIKDIITTVKALLKEALFETLCNCYFRPRKKTLS